MDRNQPLFVSYPQIKWDDAARSHLSKIAGETAAALDHYHSAVNNGTMTLHAIEVEGQRVGSLSYMMDQDFVGDVLFVTGMGAEPVEGVNLTRDACAIFLPALAKSLGCKAIRFWTRREGFVRALSDHGFAPVYVMEKAID